MSKKSFVACLALLAACLTATASRAVELPANDYPTAARADYVFACMQTNGQNRIVLEKCSCSIDTIASLLPYEEYEAAETIMSVRQKGGESVAMFNSFAPYLEKVKNLKRAQVEAELRVLLIWADTSFGKLCERRMLRELMSAP